jgi:hypothetical protein
LRIHPEQVCTRGFHGRIGIRAIDAIAVVGPSSRLPRQIDPRVVDDRPDGERPAKTDARLPAERGAVEGEADRGENGGVGESHSTPTAGGT